VTNNAGMPAQNLTAPAEPGDGLPINPWVDLRAVSDTVATVWNVAVTGATAPVAMGDLVLVATLRELNVKWGYSEQEKQPVIEHRTEYGRRLVYNLGVRARYFSGTAILFTDRDALRTLHREARGSLIPFLLIPNESENDALLVQWREDTRTEQNEFITPDNADGVTEMPVAFEEVNAGLAL